MPTPTNPRSINQRCYHCTHIRDDAAPCPECDVYVCPDCATLHGERCADITADPRTIRVSDHSKRTRVRATADDEGGSGAPTDAPSKSAPAAKPGHKHRR